MSERDEMIEKAKDWQENIKFPVMYYPTMDGSHTHAMLADFALAQVEQARREMADEILRKLEAEKAAVISSRTGHPVIHRKAFNKAINIVMSIKPQNIDTSPGYGVDRGRE